MSESGYEDPLWSYPRKAARPRRELLSRAGWAVLAIVLPPSIALAFVLASSEASDSQGRIAIVDKSVRSGSASRAPESEEFPDLARSGPNDPYVMLPGAEPSPGEDAPRSSGADSVSASAPPVPDAIERATGPRVPGAESLVERQIVEDDGSDLCRTYNGAFRASGVAVEARCGGSEITWIGASRLSGSAFEQFEAVRDQVAAIIAERGLGVLHR